MSDRHSDLPNKCGACGAEWRNGTDLLSSLPVTEPVPLERDTTKECGSPQFPSAEWHEKVDRESEFDTCGSYAGTPCQDQEDGGCICDVARERDELRAEVASLSEQLEQVIGAGGEYMAEVERMRPVVEAAEILREGIRQGLPHELGQLAIIGALDEMHGGANHD